MNVVEPGFCFKVEVFLHSTNLQGVRSFIIKALVKLLGQAFRRKSLVQKI